MAKKKRQNREQQTETESGGKVDLYQSVTDKIIAELEAGRLPWVQPWDGQHAACQIGLPVNAVSGKPYSGINILLLWGAVIEKGYPSQIWLTYRQAKSLGGNVRKGERGEIICYADRFVTKDEKQNAIAEGRDAVAIPFLKRYRVFNIAQCDGLPEDLYRLDAPLPERKIVPQAEALVQATGADIRIGGDRAFYVPAQDFVQLPPQPAFTDQINYYRTCFHELGHWTGHKSRLAREIMNLDQSGRGSTKTYAREELVAEMCAAFVCATLSIQPTVRHADYIGSWLEVLKEDKRAIFKAASQASKAADYLLAFRSDEAKVAEPAEQVAA
ncbi:ArdC family protein [Salaquimonas pukyongi]|uniref:ArdC family protein n=1 Tax=Salaquimonas pukyongi TaxID=2712698 RepID=UPI00096BA4D5|nr:zincin-like metallopeptidase domain-containing protein [Salaquimonas pukyongi]